MKIPQILIIGAAAIVFTGCTTNVSNNSSTTSSSSASSNASSASNTASGEVTSQSFTLAEVAQHASRTDCWMAIEGEVYNVTNYVSRHPGGNEIVQGCGKDATSMFNSRPGNGSSHSNTARSQLQNFKIGDLKQ